jgi:hypothetical protein
MLVNIWLIGTKKRVKLVDAILTCKDKNKSGCTLCSFGSKIAEKINIFIIIIAYDYYERK